MTWLGIVERWYKLARFLKYSLFFKQDQQDLLSSCKEESRQGYSKAFVLEQVEERNAY